MLPCVAAIAASFLWFGKMMIPLHACQDNNLLLQNVEALSQDEGYSSSECPGTKTYADVGVSYMEYTSRIHYSDSIDITYDEHRTYCHASGVGKKEGYNGIRSVYVSPMEFVPCEGDKYHTLPPII